MPDPHRIVYLTAGAAGMFCGSCMHDNTLARSLGRLGVDVQLVPVYTPIRTDETDISVDQVFFGGINVYLQQKIPLLRHLPRFLDHFLDSPWLLRRISTRVSATDPRWLGDLTLSMLRGASGNQRKEVLRLTDWLANVARPEMIVLTNVLIAGAAPFWKERLRIPIAATLQGDDAFLDFLPEPYARQATALIQGFAPHIDGFLVHSRAYGEAMANRFALDPAKVHMTPLGIDTMDFQVPAKPAPRIPRTIGFLARLTPEKGLHLLIEAFLQLKQLPDMSDVQLIVAGWQGERYWSFVDNLKSKCRDAGWADCVQILGSVDRAGKLAMLARCHLVCVPSQIVEPKGLYALEAMATGVPVVMPAHGTFPELLEASRGGWLFPPGDVSALCARLRHALSDENERRQAGERGRQYVLEHRNAERTAAASWSALRTIAARFGAAQVQTPATPSRSARDR